MIQKLTHARILRTVTLTDFTQEQRKIEIHPGRYHVAICDDPRGESQYRKWVKFLDFDNGEAGTYADEIEQSARVFM
tara:strand:- start:210 stop:440 length:231 start_codon:yes stop_codon:yes gene_type:complete